MTVASRRAAIEWAQRIVANPDVCFLDTETLGKEKDAEICDIGIVGIDGVVYFDQLIRPSAPIPAESSEIHGITNEMVANAPPWNIVETAVGELLRDKHVVIYHANYDVQIINNANKRVSSDRIIAGECAMLAFAQFLGVPGFRGQWKWHRLDVAAAHFGIPPGGHRARADAETARLVVLSMAAKDDDGLDLAPIRRAERLLAEARARAGAPIAHPPPGQQALFSSLDASRFRS